MSIDTTPIGRLAADLMDAVADEFPDARLFDALLIVEIGFERDGEPFTAGRYRCSSSRASVALGLMELTADRVREPFVGRVDDGDD